MTTSTTVQHTPGPWHVIETEHSGRVDVRDINDHWICDAVQSGDARFLPEVWAENEANARLIAAAPALLDACELLDAMWRAWDGDGKPTAADMTRLAGAAMSARAAIAQARGESA